MRGDVHDIGKNIVGTVLQSFGWEVIDLGKSVDAKDIIETDKIGQVVVDPRNQRASVDGVWAAGDCTDGLYHQNNIAVGDAVKALEDIYIWLQKK